MLIIFGIPLTFILLRLPSVFQPDTSSFKPSAEIRNSRPDYVMIGNSMLGSRIKPRLLERLQGNKTVKILKGGWSASAQWYLKFKNIAVASGWKPKLTFFFFRDFYLTDPLMAIYRKELQMLKNSSEPILDSVILSTITNPWEKLEYRLRSKFEIEHLKKELENSISDFVFWLGAIKEENKKSFLINLNSLFNIKHLRSEDDNFIREFWNREWIKEVNKGEGKYRSPIWQYVMRLGEKLSLVEKGSGLYATLNTYNNGNFYYKHYYLNTTPGYKTIPTFKQQLNRSFLPHIIKLAKEHRLQLAFIRVSRRPPENGYLEDGPELKAYISDFKEYIESEGHLFCDFTNDQKIKREIFFRGDHISYRYRNFYTQYFYSKLHRWFQ
jgi:hypothetical protein